MERQRRFNGPTLEAVLADVERELGENANITKAEKRRSGGIGGFFSKEEFEVVVDTGAGDTLLDTAPAAGSVPRSILELAEDVSEAERAISPSPRTTNDQPTFAAVFDRIAEQAAPANLAWTRPDEFAGSTPHITPFQPPVIARARPAQTGQPAKSTIDLTRPQTSAVTDASDMLAADLRERGLPARWIPDDLTAHTLFESLERQLRELPAAPPIRTRHGGVVAVVGDRKSALTMARSLLQQLERDPNEAVVVTADPKARKGSLAAIIRDTEDAAECKRQWKRRETPTIVAIEAPLGSGSLAWASGILAVLEPSSTWGVIDASVKPEDVAVWSRGLGNLEALSLKNVNATVSPAAILSLGIPVTRLDGQRATSSLWAALLTEGLTD